MGQYLGENQLFDRQIYVTVALRLSRPVGRRRNPGGLRSEMKPAKKKHTLRNAVSQTYATTPTEILSVSSLCFRMLLFDFKWTKQFIIILALRGTKYNTVSSLRFSCVSQAKLSSYQILVTMYTNRIHPSSITVLPMLMNV